MSQEEKNNELIEKILSQVLQDPEYVAKILSFIQKEDSDK